MIKPLPYCHIYWAFISKNMFAAFLMEKVSTMAEDCTGITGNSSSYLPAPAWLPSAVNGYVRNARHVSPDEPPS